jgi:hypothetical protein
MSCIHDKLQDPIRSNSFDKTKANDLMNFQHWQWISIEQCAQNFG